MEHLIDRYNRPVTNLRISLTPKCNLKCSYCHREGEKKSGGEIPIEDLREIFRVAELFNINSVKLTGGEPLLRKDICEIISMIPESMQSSLTTNGTLLAGCAHDLKEAGLSRVNISIDSLSRERYKEISGVDSLDKVLAGIDAAIAEGLTPVKLNVVLLKGINDTEIDDFIEFAKTKENLVLQFIELMDFSSGECGGFDINKLEEDLETRSRTIITRRMHHRKKYCLEGAEIEIVKPMHNNEFCGHCNRLRITSDGFLKPCLLRNDNHIDIRGKRGKEMEDLFRAAVDAREPFFK
ncbi:GTP 3',8-cyclase MoaA [Methanolacinia paynteri]|uniref:GTP 3',8-cyclase MoaA n=1 Tax=Methanolacinia paynteri TaxID=230356 RepID=UPI00064F4894|nr:GTP 3',8-cyclase MoaA [Methanolacinia paynteri]